MKLLLLGAIAMASLAVGLFFLRFWRDTRDRFFLFFAAAFGIEGMSRVAQGLSTVSEEREPFFYLVRLFSFLLIIAAVVDKTEARACAPGRPRGQSRCHTRNARSRQFVIRHSCDVPTEAQAVGAEAIRHGAASGSGR